MKTSTSIFFLFALIVMSFPSVGAAQVQAPLGGGAAPNEIVVTVVGEAGSILFGNWTPPQIWGVVIEMIADAKADREVKISVASQLPPAGYKLKTIIRHAATHTVTSPAPGITEVDAKAEADIVFVKK